MKGILVVFLSLLISAETTGKYISPEVQPGYYLEEEKEERNDSEKNTHVEQSAVSEKTEVLQRNTAPGISQEDFQEKGEFALRAYTAFACFLIFVCFLISMICCCVTFFKDKMGNRFSHEQQRPASASYFDLLTEGADSSFPRAAESSWFSEKTASDVQSKGERTELERLPLIKRVADTPLISHLSSSTSSEDMNGDHN